MRNMRADPIDYNSPLGISKREWTRVLGVNLALLLTIYAVAFIEDKDAPEGKAYRYYKAMHK